ncbi:MAG TPA: hypothetical protein ACYCC3_00880 [Candidatus Azoamicus sp.]
MGISSYIIILFNHSEFFTKIFISLILILFLYSIFISINFYLEFKTEENTISVINDILNNNKNNNSNILKKNKTQSYNIYVSGINEFMYLYKKGITDLNSIISLTKETMEAEILNKNIYIQKIKIIKEILIHINVIYLILNFALYFQQENIILLQKLDTFNIILILNEMLLPITLSILIIAKIKIIENIFANLNLKIYNKQKLLIKNFLILLYHKFYD